MKERGFTIIEVALFLAISASLILLTVGLWTMVSRQRFQDTMTTLRNTIQAEYEEVRTNINERVGTNGVVKCPIDGTIDPGVNVTGNSKCLAIGKLIEFVPNSQNIKISYIVLVEDTDNRYFNMGDESALRSMELAVIGDSSSLYEVKTSDPAIIPKNIQLAWGGEFATSWTIPTSDIDSPIKSSGLAILHSPISGAVLIFSFASSNPVSGTGILNLTTAKVNQPLAIMIKNVQVGFKGGAICIDSGSSSVAARSIVPADPYYDFGSPTSPSVGSLRSLCGI
ncbi:hypothetical protein FWC31_03900 [Candidatus Saccharibacteria bacterium]|nr:hypothetical protein [Candidatus Saccharibacteria bacterium]